MAAHRVFARAAAGAHGGCTMRLSTSRGIHQDTAFPHRQGQRFLHIHVPPALMPSRLAKACQCIRSGDDHGVMSSVKQVAKVF